MPSHLEIVDLRGPVGRLEALLNTGSDHAPFAALVCHPHPPSGGTMHTKAVYHAMKAFNHFGLPVLRFNFRGAGLSEGEYDHARGEVDDTLFALDWLHARFQRPILLAGFSFGAAVGLRAASADPRVQGIVALGLPVRAAGRDYSYDFLAACPQPKLFLSGDHDEFASREALERIVESAPAPSQLQWIPDADHFFLGISESPAPKLAAMRQSLQLWLSQTFLELNTP
jgi:alpha/beta superfamily hydrolase